MLRYLGALLIVVVAAALTAAIAAVLMGEVVASLRPWPVVRVTAFDGVGPVDGPAPRLRAVFEGPSGGRPLSDPWVVFRLCGGSDGWAGWGWMGRRGLAQRAGPAGLRPGRHRYRVGLPETSRRLDLEAEATIWIWPAETRVLWVDASALVPGDGTTGAGRDAEPPDSLAAAFEPLRALAAGARCIYLVAAEPRRYAAVRRRLGAWKAPPGPAFWVVPDRIPSRLAGLKGVWPQVVGVVVAEKTVAEAAACLGLTVVRVPAADAPAGPEARRRAWETARRRLLAGPGTT